MKDKMQYYVLKEKAVPEVLLKVVEAKRLIDSGKIASVQEATESVESAAVLFTSIKMIFFLFTRQQRERPLRWSFRWMMSRDFCPGY